MFALPVGDSRAGSTAPTGGGAPPPWLMRGFPLERPGRRGRPGQSPFKAQGSEPAAEGSNLQTGGTQFKAKGNESQAFSYRELSLFRELPRSLRPAPLALSGLVPKLRVNRILPRQREQHSTRAPLREGIVEKDRAPTASGVGRFPARAP